MLPKDWSENLRGASRRRCFHQKRDFLWQVWQCVTQALSEHIYHLPDAPRELSPHFLGGTFIFKPLKCSCQSWSETVWRTVLNSRIWMCGSGLICPRSWYSLNSELNPFISFANIMYNMCRSTFREELRESKKNWVESSTFSNPGPFSIPA
jgi:hypothetical protein